MKKIYISPSDQVGNTYAVGGTNEAAQCRAIAKALVPALERCGFEAKTNTADGSQAMYNRVAESNAWDADLHIPIHTNAFDGTVAGTRMFCYEIGGAGHKACQAIMAALSPITPGTSDSITVHHYYEVKYAKTPTAYVEVGFHDNATEAQWIIDHTEDIAEAICKGVCDYFGTAYTAPVEAPTPEAPAETIYRVQVGAFRVKANAEAMLAKLHAAGFTDAYIRT